MKTFDALTKEQQEKAINRFMGELLDDIVNGAIRFSDKQNGDTLQAAIDAACKEANRMQTPWFSAEYIMDARYRPMEGHITEDDGLWPVSEAIRSLAIPVAEDTIYLERGESAVALSEL